MLKDRGVVPFHGFMACLLLSSRTVATETCKRLTAKKEGSMGLSWARPTVSVFLLVFSLTAMLHGDGEMVRNKPVPGDIIINELMVDPDMVADDDGEYIELFNRTPSGIDLNGWVLMDAGIDYHVIDNGGSLIIGPEEFMVLARNGIFEENGGVNADYEYSGFVLSNSSDEVILVDTQGMAIDSLVYSSELEFPLETGSSMELRNQYWDNTLGITWLAARESFGAGDLGSPGSENSVYEDFKWVAVDAAARTGVVSPGDSLVVHIDLFNPGWLDWSCEAASFLVLPGGSPFWGNPLDGPFSFWIQAGWVFHLMRSYYIPDAAFPGIYSLYYGVREAGGEVLDYERVTFEVSTHRKK